MNKDKNKILDNLHIALWLVKDLLWSMDNKLGVLLIPPAIVVSIYILVKQFNHRSSMYHNLAVCFWILANSTWMTCELYHLKHMNIVYGLFGAGAILLFYFYFTEIIKKIWWNKK
jgi:hypothetical protein